MHISNVSSFVLSKSPVKMTFKVSAERLERVQRLRHLSHRVGSEKVRKKRKEKGRQRR